MRSFYKRFYIVKIWFLSRDLSSQETSSFFYFTVSEFLGRQLYLIEDCSRRWRLRARSSVAGGKIFLKRSRNKRRQATKDLRLRGHLRVAIWLILSNMLMPTAKMSSLTFLWSDANIFPVRPTTVLISSHIIWALNAV